MGADYLNRFWSLSNCSCDSHPEITHISAFNQSLSLDICNALLVPSWMLAVVIGTCFGVRFLELGRQVTGSLAYSITYLMYAVMISSGLVVHCLFLVECRVQSPSQYFIDAAKIDASLTSCVAVSLAFNGLIDLKLLSERSYATMMTMAMFYGLIFYAYFSDVADSMDLYFNSILLGCSLYMLTQLIRLILDWSHTDWVEILFLVGAGIVGGSSLFLIKKEACWLCKSLGPWSLEGVWYYGSDASVLLLGVYVWKSLTRA